MIFLNSASSAAALVFDLPVCTQTDTEGEPGEARVRNIFQNLKKNTISSEHPVPDLVIFMNSFVGRSVNIS